MGQGGDNSYHYDADKVFSFSVLIHRGGQTDTYGQPRSDDQLMRTGTLTPDSPASSDCYGLFSDE